MAAGALVGVVAVVVDAVETAFAKLFSNGFLAEVRESTDLRDLRPTRSGTGPGESGSAGFLAS